MKIHSSCEIEDFVETHLCKLCVILRSCATIYSLYQVCIHIYFVVYVRRGVVHYWGALLFFQS